MARIGSIENDTIWQTVVVGNKDVPIAEMIHELGNSDWVNEGRKLLTESAICPFCQKETIDSDFRRQLEDFFDEQFDQSIQRIKDLTNEYSSKCEDIIKLLSEVTENTTKVNIGKLDVNGYKVQIELLVNAIKNNGNFMAEKQNEPSHKASLRPLSFDKILKLIDKANSNISANNNLIKNFNEEKRHLINDVWNYCLKEQAGLIKNYTDTQKNIEKALKGIAENREKNQNELNDLNALIIEKEKNTTSVQPAVNEINRLLKAYGFTNFHIANSTIQPNSYQIQREDGTLANKTLSEGEETFISFLYFMQFVKGSTDVTKVSNKKVLVLDDPISSLDSSVLFVVSVLVKDLVKKIEDGNCDVSQLIVLTHNIFFHKEVSFEGLRSNESSDTNYWIIKKDNNISQIVPYGRNNPISTSYALVWNELKSNNTSSLITVQNTMRRIIENYFSMVGNSRNIEKYVLEQFDNAEDKAVCKSLFYWINDGSHSIQDDLFISNSSDSIQKYKDIFRQIFEKSKHGAHYNMMMGIPD